MKKFYYAQNANRVIGGVRFTLTDIVAGTVVGVYAAENPEEIAALDKLAADPKAPVDEITEADYLQAVQKKTINLEPSHYSPVITAGAAMKGPGAVVVSSSSPEPEESKPVEITTAPLAKVEDALKVKPMNATPEPKPKKGGK